MRIALVSFEPKIDSLQFNLNTAKKYLKVAKDYGASMCVFPESTFTSFCFPSYSKAEFLSDSTSINFLKHEASDMGISIAFGLFIKNEFSTKVHNSLLVIDKSGEIILRYDKLHLFSPGKENQYNLSGEELKVGIIGSVPFGVSICYDLRFPELYSAMSPFCKVILNLANWPSVRSHHWQTLLRARAIENQLFLIGVNRYGFDQEGTYFAGDSMIYDPLGELVRPEFANGAISIYSLDFDLVSSVRSNFPVLKDRRFKVSLL